MQPKKSITEKLTSSIELEDQALIEEIIESEDWLGELNDLWEEAIYPDNRTNSSDYSMLDRETSRQERKEGKTKGLTPEERKHVEESMRRHDTLMRRLSKM